VVQLVEHPEASNRKIANPCCAFDAVAHHCILRKTLNAIFYLAASSLSGVMNQPEKETQTDQLLCWSGKTDTEHTSGSNKKEAKHW